MKNMIVLRKCATVLALVASVCTISCREDPPAIIESGTIDNLTWTFAEDGTLTISGNGGMGNIQSGLDYPWHPHRDAITAVVMEDGVTSVGEMAFWNCSSLTSAIIPCTITSVGGGAFFRCSGLTAVTIPGSVVSFGKWVFYGCTGLTEIVDHATIPQRTEREVWHDNLGLIEEFYDVNKNTCMLRVPAFGRGLPHRRCMERFCSYRCDRIIEASK